MFATPPHNQHIPDVIQFLGVLPVGECQTDAPFAGDSDLVPLVKRGDEHDFAVKFENRFDGPAARRIR
jgi:hypothetical protein